MQFNTNNQSVHRKLNKYVIGEFLYFTYVKIHTNVLMNMLYLLYRQVRTLQQFNPGISYTLNVVSPLQTLLHIYTISISINSLHVQIKGILQRNSISRTNTHKV